MFRYELSCFFPGNKLCRGSRGAFYWLTSISLYVGCAFIETLHIFSIRSISIWRRDSHKTKELKQNCHFLYCSQLNKSSYFPQVSLFRFLWACSVHPFKWFLKVLLTRLMHSLVLQCWSLNPAATLTVVIETQIFESKGTVLIVSSDLL